MNRAKFGKRPFLALALGLVFTLVLYALAEWIFGLLPPRPYADPLSGEKAPLIQGGAYWTIATPPSRRYAPHEKIPYPLPTVDPELSKLNGGRVKSGIMNTPQPWERAGKMLLLPRKSHRSIHLLPDGRVLWDLTYTMDSYGRRVVPAEDKKKKASRFLMLLGDSFSFGYGVKVEETFAARLGGMLKRYRAYNYSLPGAYPGELLDWLRLVRGSPEILERHGTVLYFFGGYQVFRTMGQMGIPETGSLPKPHYYENPQGEIVADEISFRARPLWTWAARQFMRSNITRHFRLRYPAKPSAEDWDFELKIIQATKREAERFGADQFIVVGYPLNPPLIRYEMGTRLVRAGIHFVDFGGWNMEEFTKGAALIPFDGHFTAEGHSIFAEALYQWVPWL